ncbi:type II toxin-antitoxin system HicA family toxin [Geminocystis sp.]|uniref:type II toxin-antitoxin system HicA family toxin n=1 Tax=Geminocystis sp. TaxID=2664100 RepID=UPI00359371B4
MKSVSGNKLSKIVQKYGWVLKRIKGSDHIFEKEGLETTLSIPIHSNKDLKIGTLKAILKQANLTEDDLF